MVKNILEKGCRAIEGLGTLLSDATEAVKRAVSVANRKAVSGAAGCDRKKRESDAMTRRKWTTQGGPRLRQ